MITEINLTPTSSIFEVPSTRGASLAARSWGNPGDSKAIVLLVHGLGAHSGWFEAFARQLKVRSLFVVAYDHAGFGMRRDESVLTYQTWLDDLIYVFEYIKALAPSGKPIYLAGNSMGGLLSLVAVQRIQPDGLILLSPGFDGYPETFSLGYKIRTIASAVLRPDREVALPYDANLITRDEGARRWINNDVDGRLRVPGRFLLQLLLLSNAIKNKPVQLTMPVLMLTAGQDKIVDNRLNMLFFDNLKAPVKRRKQFPESSHDLMFDPRVDEVADEVLSWISASAGDKVIQSLQHQVES